MIVPAIIPQTKKDLFTKILSVKDYVDVVHIDICDGKYVPTTSWPGKFEWNDVEALENGDEPLPGWEKVDFEVDLMVRNPKEAMERFIKIGISSAIIHAEKLEDSFDEIYNITREFEIKLGLAFLPATDVKEFTEWIGKADFIQCMGISRIGYQGQDFDERVFDQIAAVQELKPDAVIAVDGHVDEETIQDLAAAGATKFVVGSAILNATSIPQKIAELKQILHEV
jgi:ribulose-phosphate 3-epimerase